MGQPQTDLISVIQELQRIYERVDKERLGVWLDEFAIEYPALVSEIHYCANMKDERVVISYLIARDARFYGLKLIPNVEGLIKFLMDFINERRDDYANSALHHRGDVLFLADARARRKRPDRNPPRT